MKAPYARRRAQDSSWVTKLAVYQDYYPPIYSRSTTATVNYFGRLAGEFQVMTDVVTPGFRRRIAAGEIINNGFDKKVTTFTYGVAAVISSNTEPPANAGTFIGSEIGHYGAATVDTRTGMDMAANMTSLVNESTIRYLASVNARNNRSKIEIQSLVAVAELHKTVALIGDSLRDILSLYRAIRKGDLPGALKALGGERQLHKSGLINRLPKNIVGSLSRRWLEWRYGWTPLVMDVQGSLRALSKVKPSIQRRTARGGSSRSGHSEWSRTMNLGTLGNEIFQYVLHHEVHARAYCLFQDDLQFNRPRDFGVTEFPLAVWELVPFSFVVDWFINVGDWLEAVTPKVGIKMLAEGVTVKSEQFLLRNCTGWVQTQFGAFPSHNRTGQIGLVDTMKVVHSYRLTTLDASLRMPLFNVKLNKKRVADSIALLVQQLGISSSTGQRI